MTEALPLQSESTTQPPRKSGFKDRPDLGYSLQTYFLAKFIPKSSLIALVTPGSILEFSAEQTSKHAEPGVALVRSRALEVNFLNLTFIL